MVISWDLTRSNVDLMGKYSTMNGEEHSAMNFDDKHP